MKARKAGQEVVARAIKRRREALRISQQEAADRVGVGLRAFGNAERGATWIRDHVADWESFLGWPPGAIDVAYTTGAPPRLLDPGEQPLTAELPGPGWSQAAELVEDARARLGIPAERAARLADMTLDDWYAVVTGKREGEDVEWMKITVSLGLKIAQVFDALNRTLPDRMELVEVRPPERMSPE